MATHGFHLIVFTFVCRDKHAQGKLMEGNRVKWEPITPCIPARCELRAVYDRGDESALSTDSRHGREGSCRNYSPWENRRAH